MPGVLGALLFGALSLVLFVMAVSPFRPRRRR